MPNTGHVWTEPEDAVLIDEYNQREASESIRSFADRFASGRNLSSEAVRNRIAVLERGVRVPPHPKTGAGDSYEEGERFISVVCASERILSQDEIIKRFRVDLDKWELKYFRIKPSEGYRKDRKVSWHVSNGHITSGHVEDTGRMLIVPLYSIEARFERKTDEIRARMVIEQMVKDAAKHAPKYPKIVYKKPKNGMLYEIDMPDIHFGRQTWKEESGAEYNIEIAGKVVRKAIADLLAYTKLFPVERILLPLGNDFFNVNNKGNTTVHGTPQQEDERWQKTFRAGLKLAVEMIDACAGVAPVDVLIVKGNHDEERTFYMGEVVAAWYHKCPNVNIENGPKGRKYYLYGKNLIGFTHGSEEKLDRLPLLMPVEAPDLWAKSTYREFHLGDKHHFEAKEYGGVVVRILRSLAAADAWTFDRGFIGALRAAESFVWDKERGLIAQFTVAPEAEAWRPTK